MAAISHSDVAAPTSSRPRLATARAGNPASTVTRTVSRVSSRGAERGGQPGDQPLRQPWPGPPPARCGPPRSGRIPAAGTPRPRSPPRPARTAPWTARAPSAGPATGRARAAWRAAQPAYAGQQGRARGQRDQVAAEAQPEAGPPWVAPSSSPVSPAASRTRPGRSNRVPGRSARRQRRRDRPDRERGQRAERHVDQEDGPPAARPDQHAANGRAQRRAQEQHDAGRSGRSTGRYRARPSSMLMASGTRGAATSPCALARRPARRRRGLARTARRRR